METPLELLAIAVAAVTATLGIFWLARVRAGRRFRSVLDAYVEQEQAKRTYSRRDYHARPQSKTR